MDPAAIESLLNEVREGQTGVADALEKLRILPFEDLGFAKLDHHRALRTGMPEVIFAAGKTTGQVSSIFARMAKAGGNVLATRASREMFDAVLKIAPRAEFHEAARAITLSQNASSSRRERDHRRSLRWNKRSARGRRGCDYRSTDGQRRGTDRGCGRGRDSQAAGAEDFAAVGARADCMRRDGGCTAHRGGRDGPRAGAGRSYECWIWRILWRGCGTAGDAEHLLTECLCCQYRQRIWSGLHCFTD